MDKKRLEKALKLVGKTFGLDIDVKSEQASYSEAKFSVTFREAGQLSSDQRVWNGMCQSYGMKPEHFGAKFNSRGRIFTITGVNSRAPTYPIKATRSDGRKFKFPPHMIVGSIIESTLQSAACKDPGPTKPLESMSGGEW